MNKQAAYQALMALAAENYALGYGWQAIANCIDPEDFADEIYEHRLTTQPAVLEHYTRLAESKQSQHDEITAEIF